MKILHHILILVFFALTGVIFSQDEKSSSTLDATPNEAINTQVVETEKKEAAEQVLNDIEKTQTSGETEKTSNKDEKKIPAKNNKQLFGSDIHKKSIGLTDTKKSNSGEVMLKTCISLAAVIGLILLIFYAIKKINNKVYVGNKNNPLRVFSRMPLDNKNYLTLVRAYEEEFLLSVGPNGTTVVARYAIIGDEDEPEVTPVNSEGKRVFKIDTEEHITSINLSPIKAPKNEE
ncbi:MAG: flagellar biosynthetic protein FliO [Lentisphaeraceae bacterium]|nr:flagellar biosynthetic protein FliO [Lentisphaeraceae bacterium]